MRPVDLGPPGVVLQETLESVQKRAARLVTSNYNYETGSITGNPSRKGGKTVDLYYYILLYKGLKGKASLPKDDLIPKTWRGRNLHSTAFQTPVANKDVYKGDLFHQTIRNWNALPDSLLKMQRILQSSLLW